MIKRVRSSREERRMSVRIPARLQATIEFPPRREAHAVTGLTADLCFDGAFIMHSGTVVPKGLLARVTLHGGGEPVVIDALVLRGDERGTALLFADYEDTVFDHLAELLKLDFADYLDARRSAQAAAPRARAAAACVP